MINKRTNGEEIISIYIFDQTLRKLNFQSSAFETFDQKIYIEMISSLLVLLFIIKKLKLKFPTNDFDYKIYLHVKSRTLLQRHRAESPSLL